MSFLSRLKKALKKAQSAVSNTANRISSSLKSSGQANVASNNRQVAEIIARNAVSGGGPSTSFTPQTSTRNISGQNSTPYSAPKSSSPSYAQIFERSNPSGTPNPFTGGSSSSRVISSGKQKTSGGGSSSTDSSFSLMSSSGTFDGARTLTSTSLGGSTGTGTLSSTNGGTAVALPSNPGSTNPKIDNTALAGTLSGYYQRNPDGTFTEVEQETETSTEDKVADRAKMLEDYLGVKESVYDDREVKRAMREKQRIQEMLQAPTAELNAVIAKQNADILAHRQMVSANGGTDTGFGGIESAINYNAAIRALPLQASIASLQGELELAQDYLKELITVKTEQIDRQYEYRKQVFSSIEGILDEEDKRAYEEQKTANDRAYEEEKDLIDTQFELSQMVMQNAPESVRTNILNRINAADSKLAALQAAGRYAIPANTQITTLDNGDTVVVDKNTGRIVSNLGGRKVTPQPSVAGLTPEQANDPFIKKLAASAGGKPITDTFAQQLNKGLTVLGQVGTLQENIKNVKTGPIVGAFKGLNPWDTNAQTIKAQLNAVVPNLARGVYGEVGVLTDNDIANYSKTLPTLKSTEDVRNAVLGITVDLIGKSLKRNLEINAANGKDVSGFIDIYTEMIATRDSIFSNIEGYGNTTVDLTPEIKNFRSKYDY